MKNNITLTNDEIIQAVFHLSRAEPVEPDEDEILAMSEYHNGNPDYRPTCSHEEVLKELGLQ